MQNMSQQTVPYILSDITNTICNAAIMMYPIGSETQCAHPALPFYQPQTGGIANDKYARTVGTR